jgi:hypothetical protein
MNPRRFKEDIIGVPMFPNHGKTQVLPWERGSFIDIPRNITHKF